MANPKTGLNYYTLDTDRYQDIRIKRLKRDLGCRGIAIYDYLLCEIYRVRGCFIAWDENTALDVAEYFNLKESVIEETVKYCASVGLFDKELLERGVITSKSIQKRYIEMCTRAKRNRIEIPEECKIIPEESHIIPEESHIIPEVCRKVKESKVKETSLSRGKENLPPPVIAPIPLTDCYNRLQGNSSWKETVLMNIRSSGYPTMTPSDIDKWLVQFFSNLAAQGEDSKQPRDAQSHFVRWLRIELKKIKDEADRNTHSRKQSANQYALNQLADSYTDMADTLSDPF